MSRIHRRGRYLLSFLSRISVILGNTKRQCARLHKQNRRNRKNRSNNNLNDVVNLLVREFHNQATLISRIK